ncbi:hypothetical protein CCMSSC00406_0004932 [Pleurotus cornucopiae]|uniref:Uncharacterized protein n=1 Tax=Pleurotus cornucopiae TaxID=5321 RepID=A0ACB7IZY5_PLECO|nr:hypothetical protein CCMSSC00406_0004932 [Pleurotus cornucopiae]
MASNLYETLGVARNASPEQIRKAYKKMALQTHPDRLSPNATPDDKAASEERFRQVNNAYEVLIDEETRKVYDREGVWPPPEPEYEEIPRRSGPRHHSSQHHFRTSPMGAFPGPFDGPFFPRPFGFTDPFVLFESVFGDLRHEFGMPHDSNPYEHRYEPDNPFERMNRMHRHVMSQMDMFSGFMGPQSFGMPDNNSRWASESHMVSSVNGVTQSVHKRRDWEGNVHVTRTLPDGRETYTINGIEQPSPATQNLTYDRDQHSAPPQVTHIQSTGGSHYPQNNSLYHSHRDTHGIHRRHSHSHSHSPSHLSRHRDHHPSDSHPVIPGIYPDPANAPVIPGPYDRPPNEDHVHRKRWWRGHW